MSDHENPLGDVRFGFLNIGTVTNRRDPDKLGRVKVLIPGLCEPETGWAWPMGAPGGGSKKRGKKWVPQVGAEVAIFFKGGDPDCPYYFPAHWGAPGGKSEIPTNAADADRSEDIHVEEYDRYIITVNEIPGKEGLTILDKKNGDGIEWDGVNHGLIVTATSACVFKVLGAFIVDANMVVLNGRKLSDGSQSF